MSEASGQSIVVEKSSGSLTKAIIALGVIVGGYFAYKSWNQKRLEQQTEGQLQDDKSVQYATLLRGALDKWFGSDTQTILTIAPQITDFDAVARAYNNLYKSILTQDLTNKLSAGDLTQFYTLMRVKGRPQTDRTFIDRNVSVADLKKSSPVYLNWSGKTNITLFKNSEDYPVKPYIRIAKPNQTSAKPFGVLNQVDRINYKNGSVTATLAWVQIASGQKYWIRTADLKTSK